MYIYGKGIQINWKICDNAEECNGIAVCPTGALYWDKEEKKNSSPEPDNSFRLFDDVIFCAPCQ